MASQTPSLRCQPAWPQRSRLDQARFGYIVPNLFMNWTYSGVWYQIYLWTDQIQVSSTKFTNERSSFFAFSYFLNFVASQTLSLPASKPGHSVARFKRLGKARFGYIVPNLQMKWTYSGIWYQFYLWIVQIQISSTTFTNESNSIFQLLLFLGFCGQPDT